MSRKNKQEHNTLSKIRKHNKAFTPEVIFICMFLV